jgi:hypothetical protein
MLLTRNLLLFAAGLLPLTLLAAQEPSPQDAPQPPNRPGFQQPSPEAMRQIAERRRLMRERANAINDLAGHIQSADDARKLIDLVAAEFSAQLPPKWAIRSIRNRIARAEFESAADPGALIPEQHVADAWNDYLEKIGAPQESFVTAAEIHTLRDTYYVTTQLSWTHGNQNVWTVPNIYAVGPDGKVANGCRALEVLNILWQLGNQPELLQSTRDLMKKDQLWSEMVKNPPKPLAAGSEKGYATFSVRAMPQNAVQQAALKYMHDRGTHALNSAIEGLLKTLFAG